jgi:nucleotidyltransferase DUF2204
MPRRNYSRAMESEFPHDLENGLKALVESLNSLHIRFTLIGGLAVGYRSRPRFTRDIDVLLEVPQLLLPGLLGDLQSRGFSFNTEQVIRQWTRDHLTVLSYHGVNIDWLKPVIPLYQHVIDQARTESFLGCSFPIASPESLILTKLIAFRSQDQVDIESLLAANPGQLDLDTIRREWLTLAEEKDPRFVRFQEMVNKGYLPQTQSGPHGS